MNKTTLESLEEALERLEQIDGMYSWAHLLYEVREAMAEQEKQEPVAWLNPHNQAVIDVRKKKQIGEGKGYPNFSIPLYAAPVERQWVDLTDDELKAALEVHQVGLSVRIGRIAIAAFKEKNK